MMTEPTTDEEILKGWIGRTESATDTLHAGHARKLAGTLDDPFDYSDSDPLPVCWHWAYFPSPSPQAQLGRDGHPERGDFLPPVALPRRMWAGSELTFEKRVLLGETVTKTSTIENVAMKSGRSGQLCFVTIRHVFAGPDGDHRFTDRQTIVYRDDPKPGDPAPAPAQASPGDVLETVNPDPPLLFRYSALTFNTHRIHYDRDYCINVEGYPGLVVHGPLQATLLARAASRDERRRAIKTIAFRAKAALYDTSSFTIAKGNGSYWTQSPQGGVGMSADVTFF
ncbi:MAG: MaoC family dehydratase N-terminal domain-containing protein [Ahrensia sp.]|nr:MaoC family dehydratase N-terminal domain-containing protein [Ahrensia sp.]